MNKLLKTASVFAMIAIGISSLVIICDTLSIALLYGKATGFVVRMVKEIVPNTMLVLSSYGLILGIASFVFTVISKRTNKNELTDEEAKKKNLNITGFLLGIIGFFLAIITFVLVETIA